MIDSDSIQDQPATDYSSIVQKNANQRNFYSFISIILGGLSGVLISVPISFNLMESPSRTTSLAGILLLPLFGLIGIRVGYLRRHSRLFFYTSALTILLLATMLGFSFMKSAVIQP